MQTMLENLLQAMLTSSEHYKPCYYIYKLNIQATLPCFTHSNSNNQISEILLKTTITSSKQ